MRRFLPKLIQLIWDGAIDPGVVFDLTLPLEDAAEGYKAMDERRATKVLLTIGSCARWSATHSGQTWPSRANTGS